MKIGFATDTNMIKLNDKDLNSDVDFLKNTRFYIDYIESLERLDIKTQLVYIMPSIIIEELYNQKLSAFNKRYESFQNNYNEICFGLSGILPKNIYKRELNIQKAKKRNFLVVKPLITADEFEKVMNDALNKVPPFNKEFCGKKSDAGFKDYMIWRTLVNNKFEDFDKIYFFTGDKVFYENKEMLEKQFNKKHKRAKVSIVYINPESSDKIKESLEMIIDDYNLPETDVVKLYDYEMNLNNIKKIDIKLKNDMRFLTVTSRMVKIEEIEFSKFEMNDIVINEVYKQNNDYCVKIEFDTLKYITDKSIEEKEKVDLIGTIILTYKKNGMNYEIKQSDIENITFEFSKDNLENLVNNFEFSSELKESLTDFKKFIILNDIEIYKKNLENTLKYFNYYIDKSDIKKSWLKKYKDKKNENENNDESESKKV